MLSTGERGVIRWSHLFKIYIARNSHLDIEFSIMDAVVSV